MRHLLVAGLLFVASCDQPYVADDLNATFMEASAASGVPKDVLMAVAYAESRFDHREGVIGKYGRVGIMGMSAVGGDPSLARAASLSGYSEDRLQRDPDAQVMAAAMLLRAYAEEEFGHVPSDVTEWFPALSRYSGASTDRLASGYARQIYRFLEGGFIHRTPEGERVEVVGRQLGMDYAELQQLYRGTTDYAGAAAFDAAASCNYTAASRGVGDIDYVVIHTAEGSYSGTVSWFQNCAAGVSAHYVVRSSDGEVTQMLSESDIGWHAGNWDYNERSIGIEHEGYTGSGYDWYSEAMYRETAALVADICDRYGIPKDRAHIIGHDEVPDPYGSGTGGAGHHTDPGAYWDWDYFMGLVGGASGGGGGATVPEEVSSATGDLTGYIRVEDIYSGAGVAGAEVLLSDGQVTTTDGSGLYKFLALEEGAYSVTVTAGGYDAASDTKDVQADILNWKSVAVYPSGSGSSGTSAPVTAPGVPTGLAPDQVEVPYGGVTMSWVPSGDAATQYELEVWHYRPTDGTWTYHDTYFPSGDSHWMWPSSYGGYGYSVRGYNDGGWGGWSDWGFFLVTP